MTSLSPSQTSFFSGSEGVCPEGPTEVERWRQIHFNNKLSVRLENLQDLPPLPSPCLEKESLVNTKVHIGWSKQLTPTPSPSPPPPLTILGPREPYDIIGAPRRRGKKIGSHNTPKLCLTSPARNTHFMVKRSDVDKNTQFFQLNSQCRPERLQHRTRRR